jgi:N-acyl homoserine lactone hydrolase
MTTSPITRIRVFSIGEVRVRPKNVAGTGTPTLLWTFTSRTWTEPLPVNVVLIEHERGAVLWDTGQAPESATEPKKYFPGGIVGAVYARHVKSTVTPEQGLGLQLAAAGVPVESLALAAISHLHYDHAGNVGALAGAGVPVLVSEGEHALLTGKSPEMHGILSSYLLDEGVQWQPVSFAPTGDAAVDAAGGGHDIFGDGSLVLIPTPGHSPGSMSLLVRRAGQPPLLLVGDVTYDPALLAKGVVPDVGDRAVQLQTAATIAALGVALPGLRIIAGHDPRASELVEA